MKCHLCKNEISNYCEEFNELIIDENNSVKICQECIKKFMDWQAKNIAKLFPTSYMKKRFKD